MKSAGKSDSGLERANNEDRFHDDPERGIFIVIDGVGGHAAGEKAADVAVSKLRARLERLTGSVAERIHEAITIANNEIYRLSQTREEWRGMACVLTVAVVEDGHATIGHVGDTRLYKLHRGQIRKITHDHSPVGEREDMGELSELEAMQHPRRNEVYRDVGTEPHEPNDKDFIELIETPFEPDCALLMCSDGLSDLVTSVQMLRIVQEHAANPHEVVTRLIETANSAGGKDNVTVLFTAGDQFTEGAQKNGDSDGASPAPEKIAKDMDDEQTTKLGRFRQVKQKLRQRITEKSDSRWARPMYGALLLLCVALLGVVFLSPVPRMVKERWFGMRNGVLPGSPSARRLVVGDGAVASSFATIKEALDMAQPGDTIEVAPGEYHEQVVLIEGVNLLSQKPYAAVIRVPAAATEPRVAIVVEKITTGRISGFKVVGDAKSPLDIGLRMVGSNVEITQLEISGAQVAGIDIEGEGTPIVSANLIRENSGSGVVIHSEATPRIIYNWITGNGRERDGEVKPGIEIQGSTRPVLIGNVIAENGAEGLVGLMGDSLKEVESQNYFGGDVKENGKGKVRTVTSVDDARRDNNPAATTMRARPARHRK